MEYYEPLFAFYSKLLKYREKNAEGSGQAVQSDAIRTKATTELNEHKQSKLLSALSAVIKRSLDIFFSILGLIILSPVYLGIAIVIKKESPGPVIFKGLRMCRW